MQVAHQQRRGRLAFGEGRVIALGPGSADRPKKAGFVQPGEHSEGHHRLAVLLLFDHFLAPLAGDWAERQFQLGKDLLQTSL